MLAGGPPLAVAAAEGTAVGVDPDAVARRGSADRTLVVGADISVGERIVTGPSGRVQVLFADQTRLVVGPGSALLIESYLMNGDTADKFAINALAGTFRFISGNSPKSAYSIETPTAAIAVRGTKFDVSVAGDLAWIFAEGNALLGQDDGERAFPYRLSSVLRFRDGTWRWQLFHGSEPAG